MPSMRKPKDDIWNEWLGIGIRNLSGNSQYFVEGFGFLMVPGDMCCPSSSKTSVIDFLLEFKVWFMATRLPVL